VRTQRNASLAVILFLLLMWALLPIVVQSQGPVGHLVVSTDYELFGTSDLRGGGHVTWTLTGARAAELRSRILRLFDTYPTVPRGFSSEGTDTNGNRNQVLDAAEGVVYTNLLEGRLEAAGQGSIVQYLQLSPFDLRDKVADDPTSFSRSTSGLANTDLNATADVEIRFLFEANITTTNGRVPLATRVLADSLYEPFSYRAMHSPDLNQPAPYPGSWPFLSEGGWHVVNATGRPAFWGGRPAFWAGNDSTGMYDNNVNAAARTTADPAFASILPVYEPFDLRYASRAWATFNYTGALLPGDILRLEFAHPPAYTDWTALPFSTGASLPNSPGGWTAETVDLTSLLGQRARLRFHFVSDGLAAETGIFIRDFAIEAPANYVGEVVESDTHYLIGTLSFSDPAVSSGGIHLIRTPGGELLFYGATWTGSPPESDTIHFRTFAVTENPQILFGVMMVSAYAISRMQESAYHAYREAHPPAYRPAVHRTKGIHRAGKVAMGVLVLLYFVPTAFWPVGLRIFVAGIAYWLLAVGLVLLLRFGTRAHYRHRLQQTPPPVFEEEETVVRKVVLPAPSSEAKATAAVVGQCTHCLRPIRVGERSYRCACGAAYHLTCATALVRCSNCRKPIAADVLRARKQVSLRCEACGDPQTLLEGIDPRAATCANCGARLRHIDEGKRYLVVAGNPAIAFAWLHDLTQGRKPALCLTPASPERMRLEFGVQDVPIVQVSSTAQGAIDPRQLDPLGLRSILPLVREGKGGVILYDGIDEMIGTASLGEVIRFLRKANDLAFVHGVTVIARVSPGRLTEDEVKRLNAEFDEYLDLSAQL
jgi:hypothetical protein